MTTIVLAGLSTVDLIQRVAEFPPPGGKAQSGAAMVTAGGPAANAARTVAGLGGTARLLTAIGDHPLGAVVRGTLADAGVSIVDFAGAGFVPPVSAVTVRESDGERTIVSRNAADAALAVTGSRIGAALSTADAVLLDGHHPELALAVARQAEVPVLLDAGSWRPVFAELLAHTDVCACSAAFAFPDGRSEREFGAPVVTRTHGPDPVHWWAGGEHGTVAVPALAARNTAGAGDAWHGALAHGVGGLGRVPRAGELAGLIGVANAVAGRHVTGG